MLNPERGDASRSDQHFNPKQACHNSIIPYYSTIAADGLSQPCLVFTLLPPRHTFYRCLLRLSHRRACRDSRCIYSVSRMPLTT
ncbi:hypothetical protein [Candidatus Symbiopectobacterium sp.]|uniref:hypothetical protein n=1 Tax=Candidatus Symbiopectobacterium sp. TaxID=2816440 RepID=UPI0025B895AD|nr:hypothetical protein [Candidatus Symbiopectobacterium sp.]